MSCADIPRLVGGGNACEGRLEITGDDDVFGQACDRSAGANEAMVICRQLGCDPSGATRVDPVQ